MTPGGAVTEFTNPAPPAAPIINHPTSITTGSDGDLWFADGNNSAIGQISPNGTTFKEYSSGMLPDADPDTVTLGPDASIWFSDQHAYGSGRAVGSITPTGAIHEFTSNLTAGLPLSITAGADGNLWVQQQYDMPSNAPQTVDRIATSGTVTPFTAGLETMGGNDGDEMITGPDGNLWFSDTPQMPSATNPYAIGKVSLEIPAKVTTGAASAITSSSATLTASVNTLGSQDSVSFQYGTTMALGSQTSAVTLPASGTAAPASLTATGLPAGTTIYYRAVASNITAGAGMGQIQSFRTTGTAPTGTSTTTGTGTTSTTSTTTKPKLSLSLKVKSARVLYSRPRHSKDVLDVITLTAKANASVTATLSTRLSYKLTRKRTKTYLLKTVKVKLKANRSATVELKLSRSLLAVLTRHRLSAKFVLKDGPVSKTVTATVSRAPAPRH